MSTTDKEIRELRAEVENIKHVLYDLLEVFKNAKIHYKTDEGEE